MAKQIPSQLTVTEMCERIDNMPATDRTGFFRCLALFWTRDRIAICLAAYSAMLIERGEDEIDIDSILSPTPVNLNQKRGLDNAEYDYGESQIENPINRQTKTR